MREKIGFVFQSYQLIPTLTAFENVEAPLDFDAIPKEERTARVEEALIAIGLKDRIHQCVTELSGGEQQRGASQGSSSGSRRCFWPTSRQESICIFAQIHKDNKELTKQLYVEAKFVTYWRQI